MQSTASRERGKDEEVEVEEVEEVEEEVEEKKKY